MPEHLVGSATTDQVPHVRRTAGGCRAESAQVGGGSSGGGAGADEALVELADLVVRRAQYVALRLEVWRPVLGDRGAHHVDEVQAQLDAAVRAVRGLGPGRGFVEGQAGGTAAVSGADLRGSGTVEALGGLARHLAAAVAALEELERCRSGGVAEG